MELVELLTSLGLSIQDQSRNGWDVFMWACLGGHAAVVTKLVALGSNIGVKDREDRLGLHWAAEKGHADAVGVLVRDMLQANLDIQATVRQSCFRKGKKGQENNRKGQKREEKKRQDRTSKQRKGQKRREKERLEKKRRHIWH